MAEIQIGCKDVVEMLDMSWTIVWKDKEEIKMDLELQQRRSSAKGMSKY